MYQLELCTDLIELCNTPASVTYLECTAGFSWSVHTSLNSALIKVTPVICFFLELCTDLAKLCIKTAATLASFPGPAQLSVASSTVLEATERWAGPENEAIATPVYETGS